MGRYPSTDPRQVFPLRLSSDELAQIRSAAEAAHEPPSSWARAAALKAAVGAARTTPPRNVCQGCGDCEGERAAHGYIGERCARVYTPTSKEPSCYEVCEADSLITSHDPKSWNPDARYPRAVQERDYRGDLNERAKVERIAQAPDPSLLLALVPTAIDGPPVVSGSGIVLGGNGRTMGLRLAYERGTASAYREELAKRLPAFGLGPDALKGIKRPILKRTVSGLDSATQPELAAASSRYNEGLGNALDERARAVAQSRRLSPATLAEVAQALEEHQTLRAAMAADGKRIAGRLTADGLVTAQNRAALVAGDGGLTEAGKQLLEGAFLGLVAGTPERLSAAAPSTLAKLERITPALARVAARGNGHDLIPTVQASLDALHGAAVAGLSVEEFGGQADFTRPPPDPVAVRLAGALERSSARALSACFGEWAKAVDYDPRQATSFGAPPTPEKARGALFAALAV